MVDFALLLRDPPLAKKTFIERWAKRTPSHRRKAATQNQMPLAGMEQGDDFD
jgi:hypothetical protein